MKVGRGWKWLALAALAGGGLAAYAMGWERSRLTLEHHDVPMPPTAVPPDGLTILHLTDLHFKRRSLTQRLRVAQLLRRLRDERYQLLLLTGDLIHDQAGFPRVLDLLRKLEPEWASFYCPGNHDYQETSIWCILDDVPALRGEAGWLTPRNLNAMGRSIGRFARKVLRNERVSNPLARNDMESIQRVLFGAGVRPLVNRAFYLGNYGIELWIAGVDDYTEGQPDLAEALREVPSGAPLILLAHNPDAWLDPQVQRATLVLSGHVHGGQVRLPLLGAVHTQGTHLERARPEGWFERGTTRLFAGRGFGESLPLRFGASPQAVLLHLHAANT